MTTKLKFYDTSASCELPMTPSPLRSLKPLPPLYRYVRIGAVSYLNSKPLIETLSQNMDGNGSLSTDLPSRLADQLGRGEIDIGLIPVVEYFRNPKFRIISNSAIVCRGPVWSVRLFFRSEPKSVKRVAMDEGSRTSVALSQLLLHEHLHKLPEQIPLRMDEDPRDADADAVLVIGDRAMHPEKLSHEFRLNWDLGEQWYRLTGLPFVFAAWVARQSDWISTEIAEVLDRSRHEGIAAIANIVERCAMDYGLSEENCRDYLTNYIHYELDSEAFRGLTLFRKRCHDLGFIDHSST
jgi:chorismate dehydratase